MKTIIKFIPALFAVLLFFGNGYAQTTKNLSGEAAGKLKTKKILIVVTNYGVMANGDKTGLWIEEYVTPYYLLKDKGVEITVASPNGGVSPIDPRSAAPQYSNDAIKRFYADPDAENVLNNTVALSQINPADYDAVFYPGGQGPMWDIPENKYSINLIETLYNSGKPIAFVCHAPAVLKNVKTKNGELLIKGKKVAGFADTEEHAGHTEAGVPYLLEDMLKAAGAHYVKGPDWAPFSVTDGLLVTGQNPHSSEGVTDRLVTLLLAKK